MHMCLLLDLFGIPHFRLLYLGKVVMPDDDHPEFLPPTIKQLIIIVILNYNYCYLNLRERHLWKGMHKVRGWATVHVGTTVYK